MSKKANKSRIAENQALAKARYVKGSERKLNLLASGRVVNLAAGEGHPASVMDLSFALQALSVQHLACEEPRMAPGVHAVPASIDEEVARLKLASLGVEVDTLTGAQQDYLRRWR